MSASDVELSEQMDLLLDRAETTVRKYLKEEGDFPTFALAMDGNGEVTAIVAEKHASLAEEIGGILKVVLPMVDGGAVTATLIASSMAAQATAMPGLRAAMFDLEDSRGKRVHAVLPFRPRDYGGFAYLPLELTGGTCQVFRQARRV